MIAGIDFAAALGRMAGQLLSPEIWIAAALVVLLAPRPPVRMAIGLALGLAFIVVLKIALRADAATLTMGVVDFALLATAGLFLQWRRSRILP